MISAKKLNGDSLLAITNAFEGRIFVNPATVDSLTHYATNAIPTLSPADIQRVVQMYSSIPGITTALDQAIALQGELVFICPTYYLLDAFGSRSHKGVFAVSPGDHTQDIPYYFNTGGVSFTNAPVFKNPAFIASFSQIFSDMTVSGDVNRKVSTANITPFWPAWSANHTEMLFNSTADFKTPVIHTFATDPKLLARCAFWKSLAPKTGQ